MVNSKQKGAGGERAFCKFLGTLGVKAERTAQYQGKNGGCADVKCEELSDYHFEIKCRATCDVYGFLEQAERDSGTDKFAVVCYKRQSKIHRGLPWVAIMDARDFVILSKKASAYDELILSQSDTNREKLL